MKAKRRRYSVLLTYPAWMSDTVPPETYYDQVTASDPKHAIALAQKHVLKDVTGGGETQDYAYEDFPALLVIEGHPKAVA